MEETTKQSELSLARQLFSKDENRERPARPVGRVFASKIKSDYSPEFYSDDTLTDRQIFVEYNYLLRYLLNGFGLSRQLQDFSIAIYTLTKPGIPYQLSDKFISKMLGKACPNYIGKVRKHLKLWFDEKGTDRKYKNPRFIAVKDNRYNAESKEQESTEYVFNVHFDLMIHDLIAKVRENQFYERDFILAIEEVCDANKADILKFGEKWERRPQRKNRTWEQVEETLYLHFSTQINKIFDHSDAKNIAPEKAMDLMIDLVQMNYERRYLLKEPRERYTEEIKREVTDRLQKTKLSEIKNSITENENVRSFTRSITINKNGRNNHQSESLDNRMESGETLSVDDSTQSETALDKSRRKFLEKRQSKE